MEKWRKLGLTEEEFRAILQDRSRWHEITGGNDGYTRYGIHYYCRQWGIEHPSGPYTKAQDLEKSEWEALLRQGLTISKMADRLGCSTTTVRKQLRKHGLDVPQYKWQRARLDKDDLVELLSAPLDEAVEAVQEATSHLPDGSYSERQIRRLRERYT